MTIKKRLSLNVLLFVIVTVIFLAIRTYSHYNIANAMNRKNTADQLTQKISYLISLSGEWKSFHYQRIDQQWRSKFAEISDFIAQNQAIFPEAKSSLKSLKESYELMRVVISSKQMSQNYDNQKVYDNSVIAIERLSTLLQINSNHIMKDASVISQESTVKLSKLYRRDYILLSGFLVLLILMVLLMNKKANRLVKDSRLEIIEGLQELGTGNLDYRFNLKCKIFEQIDELKMIAETFNGLMTNLQRTIEEKELVITEKEQIQKVLESSEEKFRAVFENSPLAISITYIAGEMHVNNAFLHIFGYKRDEIDGKFWQDITHPDDVTKSNSMLQLLLNGQKKSINFVKRFFHKNGNIIYARLDTTLLYNDAGEALFFITIINDITEQKKLQHELENHRENLEHLIVQRTSELEEKNQELQRYNKLFIGREFRIKELRDKLKKFEAEEIRNK